MKYKHEVWVELQNRSNEYNDGAATLATKMLHKLGYNESVKIEWSKRKDVYLLTINSAGEFLELPDGGHWFDLDFIAKT